MMATKFLFAKSEVTAILIRSSLFAKSEVTAVLARASLFAKPEAMPMVDSK